MAAIAISSGTAIVLITLVVLPIAAVSFARAGPAWRGIGGGRFSIEQAPPPTPREEPAEVDRAMQETEARQMLEAKAYRRRQRGEAGEIDVEAEVARLLDLDAEESGGGHDDELRAEVRALVIARNERRARRGEEPLDVEAETDRQLADLIGLEGR
ncbi:MAG TPA: hypothetical protein VGF09_00085 [Solirubrobacterales bacterium]|jgi:hypothetical protein